MVRVHGLYRVDHCDVGLHLVQRREYLFERDLGEHLHLRVVEPEPARAQRHLRSALLARHIQRVAARNLQRVQRLQQQRRFADTGVAANEHYAALNDAAAQNPVELFVAGRRTLHLGRFDVAQRRDCGAAGQ